MRGAAPDGGEVQLLVREARTGLALQRNTPGPVPHPTAPGSSWGSGVMPGLAVIPWVRRVPGWKGCAAAPPPSPTLPQGSFVLRCACKARGERGFWA